jgi:hypothetical protein
MAICVRLNTVVENRGFDRDKMTTVICGVAGWLNGKTMFTGHHLQIRQDLGKIHGLSQHALIDGKGFVMKASQGLAMAIQDEWGYHEMLLRRQGKPREG